MFILVHGERAWSALKVFSALLPLVMWQENGLFGSENDWIDNLYHLCLRILSCLSFSGYANTKCCNVRTCKDLCQFGKPPDIIGIIGKIENSKIRYVVSELWIKLLPFFLTHFFLEKSKLTGMNKKMPKIFSMLLCNDFSKYLSILFEKQRIVFLHPRSRYFLKNSEKLFFICDSQLLTNALDITTFLALSFSILLK